MGKKYDLIVVGAGVCGCVTAHLAAKLRKNILLVEESRELGGYVIAKGKETYFHTDDKKIANFVQSVSQWDSNYLIGIPLCGSDIDTILSPINFTSIDCMFDRENAEVIKYRLIETFGQVQFVTLFDILKAENDLIKNWGHTVLKNLYTKYSNTPKEYRRSVVRWIVHNKRIYFSYYSPLFDNKFLLKPRNGYGEWFKKLIDSPYIDMRFSCDARGHLTFNEKDHCVYWNEFNEYVPIVYTGALDLLFDKKYGELSYFSDCPVCDDENLDRVQKYKDEALKYNNLILCGRLAEFKFFFFDNAISHAMSMFSEIDFSVEIKGRVGEEIIESRDCLIKNLSKGSKLVMGDLSRKIPDITILIPTFHRPEMLCEALRSALQQSCSKECYDILILDNDNADYETENVVKSMWHSNMYYYRNEKNLGAYGNMNRGMELARSKWVCMLHDDDWVLPDAIQYIFEALQAMRGRKLGAIIPRRIDVFSDTSYIHEDAIQKPNWKNRLRDWAIRHTETRYWKISEFDYYMFPYLYPAPSYGTLFNREAFLEVGGMADEYPCEDGFFFLKLARRYECFLCGQSWGRYRFVQNGGFRSYDLLQSTYAVQKYREYVSSKDIRAWIHHKIWGRAAYQVEIDSAMYWEYRMNGYNQSRNNFKYAAQFNTGNFNIKWANRLKKIWEVYTLLRGWCFGIRALPHKDIGARAELQESDYWRILFPYQKNCSSYVKGDLDR